MRSDFWLCERDQNFCTSGWTFSVTTRGERRDEMWLLPSGTARYVICLWSAKASSRQHDGHCMTAAVHARKTRLFRGNLRLAHLELMLWGEEIAPSCYFRRFMSKQKHVAGSNAFFHSGFKARDAGPQHQESIGGPCESSCGWKHFIHTYMDVHSPTCTRTRTHKLQRMSFRPSVCQSIQVGGGRERERKGSVGGVTACS